MKFKPGDRVKRVHDSHFEAVKGNIYTVLKCMVDERHITLKEVNDKVYGYNIDFFELISWRLKRKSVTVKLP